MERTRRSMVRRAGRGLAFGAGVAAGAYAAYAGLTWLRFGRATNGRRPPDSLLDRLMPRCDVAECHAAFVAAPADVTFAAECDLDLQQSAAIRAIFRARELILGASHDAASYPRALVPWAEAIGWRRLATTPGREIVMGAVTRPWDADVVFRPIPPEEFASFHEPEFVKIAWTLRVHALASGNSLALTETRAVATDPVARAKFRRYWALFSPGILLIRRVALRMVKKDAERRARREDVMVRGGSHGREDLLGNVQS